MPRDCQSRSYQGCNLLFALIFLCLHLQSLDSDSFKKKKKKKKKERKENKLNRGYATSREHFLFTPGDASLILGNAGQNGDYYRLANMTVHLSLSIISSWTVNVMADKNDNRWGLRLNLSFLSEAWFVCAATANGLV